MSWRTGLLGLIAVSTLAVWPPAVTAAPDAEQQLRQLELEWTAAEKNRDAATLRRILDDRFVSFGSSGKPVGKEEFISEVIGADSDPILSQELTDQTFVIAANTAVVFETDTIQTLRSGKPHKQVLRISATYANRDGRWVALAEQFVPVPAGTGATHFDAEKATAAYMATLSTKARERSDRYFEGGYWLILWDFLVGIGVSAVLLFTPLSQRMRDFGERLTRSKELQAVLYGALYVVVLFALTLPWGAYEGFFREHQYRMSNQTLPA